MVDIQPKNTDTIRVNRIKEKSAAAVQIGPVASQVLDLMTTDLVRWTVNTSGQLVQNSSNGSDIIFNKSIGFIGQGTSDGSDNKYVAVGGGGAASNSRGSYFQVSGNESADTGTIVIAAGNVSGGNIDFYTGNGLKRWSVLNAGTLSQDSTNGAEIIINKALSGLADNIGTLAALGSTQTDAAAITATISRVTAADGTKGVKLPALSTFTAGRSLLIINSDTTNALKVYSNAAGETLSGQSGTTAISVAAKLFLRCIKYDASNWYVEKGVAAY